MMTAAPSGSGAVHNLHLHEDICHFPLSTGPEIDLIQTAPPVVLPTVGAIHPLRSIPALHSLPGAAATIYLDFDGHTQESWGEYANVVTPVFDQDGDATTFSDGELATIHEVWARVAEDFAPFNMNITTVEPAKMANKVAVRVAIGGNWSDWFGKEAGGVSFIGAFSNSAPNVAYVFADALGNGSAAYVAEAAAHEAGHTLGLLHHSVWNDGQLANQYDQGNFDWAPIMGSGYNSLRTTWHDGLTSDGPDAHQDDLAVLAGETNGFGYRLDDTGDTQATATPLPATGSGVLAGGIIERVGDRDVYSFTTGGGVVRFQLDVAPWGANLDAALEMRDSAGNSVALDDSHATLGASLQATLEAGTYYVIVSASPSGGYGNLGSYSLSGDIAAAATDENANETPRTAAVNGPEIRVSVEGTEIASAGSIDFGSTPKRTAVTRTITVTNDGNARLKLTGLSKLPAGFALGSKFKKLSLDPGQSKSFTVRLTGKSAGNFAGAITLKNSDSDEGEFRIHLSGTVTPPVVPFVRIIDNGAAGFSTTGNWRRITGQGRQRDIHIAPSGDGSATAAWTFEGLAPGEYQVSASWSAKRVNATDAPFRVYDAAELLGTVLVNQEQAASGVRQGGTSFFHLGTFTITGDRLIVELADLANERVVADAIRIERIGGSAPAVPFPSIAAFNAVAAAPLLWATSSGEQPTRVEESREQWFASLSAPVEPAPVAEARDLFELFRSAHRQRVTGFAASVATELVSDDLLDLLAQ